MSVFNLKERVTIIIVTLLVLGMQMAKEFANKGADLVIHLLQRRKLYLNT